MTFPTENYCLGDIGYVAHATHSPLLVRVRRPNTNLSRGLPNRSGDENSIEER